MEEYLANNKDMQLKLGKYSNNYPWKNGQLIKYQYRLLDEGKLGNKHQAHLLRGKRKQT